MADDPSNSQSNKTTEKIHDQFVSAVCMACQNQNGGSMMNGTPSLQIFSEEERHTLQSFPLPVYMMRDAAGIVHISIPEVIMRNDCSVNIYRRCRCTVEYRKLDIRWQTPSQRP